MANINISAPSACYTVEKILEISEGQGNHKNYKVQWAPSWVNAVHLIGCETLINQFLNHKECVNGATQAVYEEIKQEDENFHKQNEIESASEEIDIHTSRILQNDTYTQSDKQNEEPLSEDTPKDQTDNSTNQHINQIQTNNLASPTIKIEEDDTPTIIEARPVVTQGIFKIPHTAVDDRIPGNHESYVNIFQPQANLSKDAHVRKTNLSEDNSQLPSDSTLSISSYINYGESELKQNSDFEISLVRLNQSADGSGQSRNSSITKNKHISKHSKDSSTLVLQGNFSCEGNTSNSTPNTEADFSVYSQYNNFKVSNDNILTNSLSTLQHPSKNLTNSINNQTSLHRKLGSINSSGCSTYIKQSTSYPLATCSTSEDTVTIDTTHLNISNNGNGPSDISTNSMNTFGGGFSSHVMNKHTKKHNDSDGLQFKTTSSCDVRNPYNKQAEHTRLRFSLCQVKGPSAVTNNEVFKQVTSENLNVYNVSSTLNERISSSVNYEPTPLAEVAKSQLNYERPSWYTTQKYIKNMYSCEICSITFTYQKLYERHMKVHFQKKVFKCSVCSKEFHCKYNLRCHERVHTDERPYSCEVCSRKFKDYSNLKMHIRRTHTKERPYKCNMCTKIFASTSDLKKHIRTHTGERPYGCVFCNKRFKTSSQMRGHTRTCSAVSS